MKLLGIALCVLIMGACSESVNVNGDTSRQDLPATQLTQRIIQSQVQAGGSFSISHKITVTPEINSPTTINLNFSLEPFESVELVISDNGDFQLIDGHNPVFEGTESGNIQAAIELIPLRTGKIYLKFIAQTLSGSKIRSYAIALKVGDKEGQVPLPLSTPVKRVDLPASTNY